MKKIWISFTILTSLSLINFGSRYIYDVPQALAGEFMSRFTVKQDDIELLYALDSIPGIFMAFLAGFIVSIISPLNTSLICTYLIFISAILTAWGVHSEKYGMIVAGRLVYGIFGEPLNVAQSTLLSIWFTGNSLSFASGLI